MTPYDALTQGTRLHRPEHGPLQACNEVTFSDLISTGAYRSVNAIGRLVNAIRTHKAH